MLSGCDVITNTSPVDAFLPASEGSTMVCKRCCSIHASWRRPTRTAWCRPSSASTRNTASPDPKINPATWRLQPSGLVSDKRAWTLEQLQALPQREDVTRHVCVEGWSMIGKWGGVPLRTFLEKAGADLTARYVSFHCDDPINYSTSIDMASALHPQTILCLTYAGRPITPPYGAPMRVKIPTKLGFKQPKFVSEIRVTNEYPAGYWENYGYNWFAGL
jgi:DMSO/TMAO reductase YedYZ molybdopterin-dependent catalytic subunit